MKSMNNQGYFRFPSINNDQIVFVSEDDLWKVPAKGGDAIRLTSNLAAVSYPCISPDGKWIAYTGKEEGNPELYIMPSEGGESKRLTYMGAFMTRVIGWSNDSKEVILSSDAAQPFLKMFRLIKVNISTGASEDMPYGMAHHISKEYKGKGVILGRNTVDLARWKRYRGGTAGVCWIDTKGTGKFSPFTPVKDGNVANPMWIGKRIYFISDHEGIGNIYSCLTNGKDLKKHTNHKEYYVRNASTDLKSIVYQAGGEIFVLHLPNNDSELLQVKFHGPRKQRQRKFAQAGEFIHDYNLHPDGHSLLINSRGKSFAMGNWEKSVRLMGNTEGVRHRFSKWLANSEEIIVVSDESGAEALEIYSGNGLKKKSFDHLDIGRVVDMKISPDGKHAAISNHRFELLLVNLQRETVGLVDKSDFHRIQGFDWSPDSAWLSYGFGNSELSSIIRLYNIKTRNISDLTSGDFMDLQPSFDPGNRFLYFLSYRVFNPVYDSVYFDLNFPKGMRPYLISLQKETPSPFCPEPKTPEEFGMGGPNGRRKSDKSKNVTRIDIEGIKNRIEAFPVEDSQYFQIKGLKDRVLLTEAPVQGSLKRSRSSVPPANRVLKVFDFESLKLDVLVDKISNFKVASNSETLVYRTGNNLRVLPAGMKPKRNETSKVPSRQTGWIDLNRIKLSVDPVMEWKQMYREVWRLQTEHFWTDNMSGVDWDKVHDRYRPLLDKISTRSEFSDVVWEMQGELGTSHAYEMGGDYRKEPAYHQGKLGADLSFDKRSKQWRIKHIANGDSWDAEAGSSFSRLGVNANEGDAILAVSGQAVSESLSPMELLVNQANCEVELTIKEKKGGKVRNVTIKTLGDETPVRYREWVENNRAYVHKITKGRVGYVHIPNMGPDGYAEFHRYYLTESQKEALIVDVRFNGGGHVSQLILEKLARKRVAYNIPRWGKPHAYPSHSVLGPIVALTNEYAGSDGDIFSHNFKLLELGTLVGKRTWGGVIGINPRHILVDNSLTTQPEFSFWFKDVGYGVENYGTDPHIEVEMAPQDYVANHDPQMDTAIQEVMAELIDNPPGLPDFGPKPDLRLPASKG